jgi:PAS domain S-box-containing protein
MTKPRKDREGGEAAPGEAETRYRTLLETIEAAFCVIELIVEGDTPIDCRFIDANPRFEQQLGLSNILGRTACELLPRQATDWLERYGIVARTGEARRLIDGPDVQGRWFEVQAFCIGDPGRRQVALLFTEITERRRAAEEYAQLFEAERRARERAERLQAVTAALSRAVTPEEVYDAVLSRGLMSGPATGGNLQARSGTLYLLSEDTLLLVGRRQAKQELVELYRSIPIDAPIPAAQAARTATPIWLRSQDEFIERFPHLKAQIRLLEGQAAASLPVMIEQRVLGVLNFTFAEPLAFDADERGFLLTLAAQAGQALERSRLFTEMQANETRFRTVIESTAQIILVSRPNGGFAGPQPSWERFTGKHLNATTPSDGLDAIHPDDRAAVQSRWQEALAAPAPFELEYRLCRYDGVYRHMRVRSTPVFRPDGTLAEWVTIAEDRTERRQRELNTAFLDRISQELTRLTHEGAIMRLMGERIASYLGVWRCQFSEFDLDNDTATVTYDWSSGSRLQLRGLIYKLSQFVAPEAIALLSAGQQYSVENTATDPTTAAIAAQLARMEIGALVATPYLSGGRWEASITVHERASRSWRDDELELLRELAERIWTRIERLRAEAEVGEREAQLAAFMEHSPGSLFIKDALGRYTIVNHAFLATTGKRADEVIGKTDDELFTPELAARFKAEDAEVRASGQPRRFEETFVYGEQELTFLSQKFPLPGGNIGCVGTDISERKALEAQRERLYAQEQAARAQAEEASRLKDEFLATVSHELRTPLTAFLGYAQLLQSRKRDEEYIASTVEKMVRSAKAQAQLIEDLLDISRIVNGKLRLETAPVDLSQIVYAALETTKPAAVAKMLRIEERIDPVTGSVLGDANRLQQVVWNLLSNAVKFTPHGGTVTVRLRPKGDQVELAVSDTGRGIDPEFLPYVFDRFRQADGATNRAYGGLGLGLAIVRHLVELHGGSVEAESPGIGHGATFRMLLPLAAAEARSAAVEAGAGGGDDDRCPPELEGLRVLVVDDKPELLELLHDLLAPCGANVRLCDNGRDALAAVQAWQPTVLISDIAMPGEDGYWLIEQIRALEPDKGGRLPAIALTAHVRLEERLRSLASGFQEYLPKPVSPAELRAAVARLARVM